MALFHKLGERKLCVITLFCTPDDKVSATSVVREFNLVPYPLAEQIFGVSQIELLGLMPHTIFVQCG